MDRVRLRNLPAVLHGDVAGEPYALEDVAAAHTRLESGQAMGKVVVQVSV